MSDLNQINMSKIPLVSIIVPCRNEENFIAKVLEDITQQDYPKDKIEAFVVDGMSEDRTKEIVQQYIKQQPWIQLVQNPNLTAPNALNIGIKRSKGLILRMDAHSSYPVNYISSLVTWMQKLEADNVGCPVKTVPANDSNKARAIARVMSHSFGVGNAYFRLGVSQPQEVDTVMFGFYRREVFDKIGYLVDIQIVVSLKQRNFIQIYCIC